MMYGLLSNKKLWNTQMMLPSLSALSLSRRQLNNQTFQNRVGSLRSPRF